MLDVKDKKILNELLLNSRISTTQLAKKVGVSREVATYRIKRLEEQEIIRSYFTLIDYEALRCKRHVVFMQLTKASPKKEQEILTYLQEHKYITYLSPIISKWNFVFDLIIPEEKNLREIIQEITNHTQDYLGSFIVISGDIEGKFYPTKIVGTNKEIIFQQAQKTKLDSTDKQLLRILSTNANIEYAQLSRKLDMPATTIAHRIKQLEKKSVIHGYTCSVDYKKLGWQFYNIQLKTSTQNMKQFYTFIKEHENIAFYYEYLGHENWDMDLGIIAEDIETLRAVILEIKQHFGEEIHIQNMYAVGELVKDNILPEGVLE
jgi:Lrp/AsnC family leucine-responsive transcriptional regulator